MILARSAAPWALEREADIPAYRQIYTRVRDAILAGDLAPGTRLPSTRSLASALATARGTVALAYDLLAGEGYVLGRGAAGTIVDPQIRTRPARRPVARRADVAPPGLPRGPIVFQMGLPALDAFPRKLWSRLAARRARSLTTAAMLYQDPRGDPTLRQAIASYLAIARGVACRADQVFITAGFQGALGLIARAVLAPRDPVWVEDPGYFLARDALRLAGARLVPVPVDGNGIDVAAGVARAADATLAVVTPAHQAPLGVTLSLARRLALLSWAARANAWIVEDDYDSEFRYRGRPLAALKSLDDAGRVLYVGTFSKVLFPSLRLGYLVAPDALAERLAAASALLHPQPAPLNQAITADFLEQGHFARHIRRMRTLYVERRSALVSALRDHWGPVDNPPGGMHVLAPLPQGTDDVALVARAQAQGLSPTALSPLVIEAACAPALLLSFTNLPAEEAPRAVRTLASLLKR